MDEFLPPMIAFQGKSPQPVGYCYPLGSSAVSEALAGLANFAQLAMRFSNRSPLFSRQPPTNALPLLRVVYTNYPVYEGGSASRSAFQGGERWLIEVLPIPYQHRELIKGIIVDRALPPLREWLSGPAPQGARRCARMCWYEPGENRVDWVEETEP